jgi:hypothetical protein
VTKDGNEASSNAMRLMRTATSSRYQTSLPEGDFRLMRRDDWSHVSCPADRFIGDDEPALKQHFLTVAQLNGSR